MANNSKKKNETKKAEAKKPEVKKVAKKDLDKVSMGEGTTISANWGEDDKPNITVTNNPVQKQDNSKLIGIIICLAVIAIAAILIIIAISIKNGNLKSEINKLSTNAVAENISEEEEPQKETAMMTIVSRIGNDNNVENTTSEVYEGKVITLNSTQRDEFKITIIEIKENSVVIATSTSMSEGSGPIDLRAYNTKFEIEKGKETVLKTQTMTYGDSYTISIGE